MTVVETERLRLRPWRADDLDALAAIFAIPAVFWYPFGRGLTRDETERFVDRQVNHWEDHGFGLWAAELQGREELIGYLGLSTVTWLPAVMSAVEVGWRLSPEHWGRGLATEGGRASLRFGFEDLRLDRIVSIFTPENAASGRVMVRLGMQPLLATKDPNFGTPLEVRQLTASAWRARAR